MEIKVSLLLLLVMALLLGSRHAGQPQAALEPGAAPARALMALEDAAARSPADVQLARELAATYLRLDEPAMTVAAVRAASPQLLADPVLSHRLAQGYEALGNLSDAQATASLALARCLRAVGVGPASALTAAPRFGCGESQLHTLQMHGRALALLRAWGVTDPRHDPRSALAYQLAERRVSIALLSGPSR